MITYKNILEADWETREKVRLWRNSPRIKNRMIDQSEISPERHRRWLDSLSERTGGNEVRVAVCDGVPFGIINLRGVDMSVSSCDWGFYVGDENFLGRKLGRRLLYDIFEWGFETLGIGKMYSTVRSDNMNALHTMLLAGNHMEGFLKEHMRASSGEPDAPGPLIGIYFIAQFRDEWVRHRSKISDWAVIGEESG